MVAVFWFEADSNRFVPADLHDGFGDLSIRADRDLPFDELVNQPRNQALIRDALFGRLPLDAGEVVISQPDVDPSVLAGGVFGGSSKLCQQPRSRIMENHLVAVESLDDFFFVLIQPRRGSFYGRLLFSCRYYCVALRMARRRFPHGLMQRPA